MSVSPRCCLIAVLLLLLVVSPSLRAAEPPPESRGDRMLDAYFRQQTKQIADACLADFKTKDDWERKRPELRRRFLEMMGLWPLPPRTDLKPVVTGKVDTEHFTVEKLHFQSRPGLYVTANLYVPKRAQFPAPAVLYVCGHGNVVKDGVSYGSKVQYQHHPAWFAEHGYVCMILDTLELGEIPGEHHGTYRRGMWWWQARGYTPGGVECWNAMRALDYLESRKEVDLKRLGVTGRSGGGATSWWVAAADDRPQCIVPVAGIADLYAHVVEGVAPRVRKGVITGHCDCMYPVNAYRWDFAEVAALCAPRPLMLGNSDADDIFPVAGYRRLVDKVRRIYDLYGAGDRFVLWETKGPHKDTPEMRQGAFQWLNRWLKNDTVPITDPEYSRFAPEQLKVLDRPPADAINPTIQETFTPLARVEMPEDAAVGDWWKEKSRELFVGLRDRVFRGWPAAPPALNVRPAADIQHNGLRLRAFDFTSEDAVDLRVWLLTAAKVEKPTLVVLTAVDETGWREWTEELGPPFQLALQMDQPPRLNQAKADGTRHLLEAQGWAFATVAPRGIGPTRWSEADKPADVQIRRRFPLLGQTLDGQRVWDVRRALAALRGLRDLQGAPRWLQGKGDMAGMVLYAGLFEPEVARLDLWHLPASHRDGPIFLNALQILDLPQAVALAFPKQVRLYVADEEEAKRWEWPLQLQKRLGQESVRVQTVGKK